VRVRKSTEDLSENFGNLPTMTPVDAWLRSFHLAPEKVHKTSNFVRAIARFQPQRPENPGNKDQIEVEHFFVSLHL
jgi:hypothetical protein